MKVLVFVQSFLLYDYMHSVLKSMLLLLPENRSKDLTVIGLFAMQPSL
jgi:hypothetical protein